MFKRTNTLLKTNTSETQISKKIIDKFTPNKDLFESRLPYELRGEHLPRTKINAFKKTPLRVIYDHEDFSTYTLPSRRSVINHSNISFTLIYFTFLYFLLI